jgi:L-glyceraldehyde 3-phosphate reductase
MAYVANAHRYQQMIYRRAGRSGLLLPAISLGLWQNFGGTDDFGNARSIVKMAFDKGITHFDLANNYGPPAGSAEETFGKIFRVDLRAHRDELIIATKAGYTMWKGPYGDWGSKKYLFASLDHSLKRMGLDYVDIFYHHRPDPETPLAETMAALDLIVRQGKALYIGLSNYSAVETIAAITELNKLGTPCLVHQPRYSLLDRWVEDGLLSLLGTSGIGCVPFSPLAQGLLTSKYLKGIPKNSRAGNRRGNGALQEEAITEDKISKISKLNEIANSRGQNLAQMSLSWILKDERVTSVLIGASKPAQVADSIACLNKLSFSTIELTAIDNILT